MFDPSQLINFGIVFVFYFYVLLGFAGPRYNDEGAPVPHSLLGSYDEFRKEAIKRGDLLVRDHLVVWSDKSDPLNLKAISI